jgi:uncharacterized protein YraI
MKNVSNRGWKIMLIVWLLAMACNLPVAAPQTGGEPTLSQQDLASTAVSIALTAQSGGSVPASPVPPTEPGSTAAPTATFTEIPTITPCIPTVTATADINVRTGPSTAYDIVGAIPNGGTAHVTGQNDSRSWWYIEFPSGSGRYAWVAGSVTASYCIPDALQYVVAPPLPTPVPPTATTVPPVVKLPDLYISEYSWSPVPPHMGVSFHVRVGVYNQGNAAAGAFVVQWWLSTSAPSATCSWNVASVAAHGGRILECDYTPGGWANYPSLVVADASGTVNESNEGNNTTSQMLQIKP